MTSAGWGAAPGLENRGAIVAGIWGDVALSGSERIRCDNFEYTIPYGSQVRVVQSRAGQIVHVRHGSPPRVTVLHRGRELKESADEATARANPTRWREIGSPL